MAAQDWQAGPDLDAEIARVVFGMVLDSDGYERIYIESDQDYIERRRPQAFSRHVGAAMQVFEAMVERVGYGDISADMENCKGQGLVCMVRFPQADGEGEVSEMAPLPEAICRAALAALSRE